MISSLSEIAQLWGRVLKRINEQLGEKQIFDSFFANTYIYEIRGNTILVMTNSHLSKALLSTKYKDLVANTVQEITQSNFVVEVIEEEDVKDDAQAAAPQKVSKSQEYFKDSVINSSLTFDNFVVGQFNRMASQAALIVASNPGHMYNPLFIHSHSGLGKTHLLHAIGNYVLKEKNPNAKVLYMTANNFVDEYIKFVRGEKEAQSLKDFFLDRTHF